METHSNRSQRSIWCQEEDVFSQGADPPLLERQIFIEHITRLKQADRVTFRKTGLDFLGGDRERRTFLFRGVVIQRDEEDGCSSGEKNQMLAIAIAKGGGHRDQGGPVINPGGSLNLIGTGREEIPFDDPNALGFKMAMSLGLRQLGQDA